MSLGGFFVDGYRVVHFYFLPEPLCVALGLIGVRREQVLIKLYFQFFVEAVR